MYKYNFETYHPIFFISDKEEFKYIDFRSAADIEIITSSFSTISVTCMPIFEEETNDIHLYIDEDYIIDDTMQLVFNGDFALPSRVLNIFDSDDQIAIEHQLQNTIVLVRLYVNRFYEDCPNQFVIQVLDRTYNDHITNL